MGKMVYVLPLLVVLSQNVMNAKKIVSEIKPPHAQSLCGNQFIATWKMICKLKLLKERAKPKAIIPENGMTSQTNKHIVIEKQQANSYLKKSRYRRQLNKWDDATEECCHERCTFSEVAEYSC